MKIGESASVIRHTITLDTTGETLVIFDCPHNKTIDELNQEIDNVKESKNNPCLNITDIYGETHRFFLETISRHSMKMVTVKMKAADPNPLNENYGEDEVS